MSSQGPLELAKANAFPPPPQSPRDMRPWIDRERRALNVMGFWERHRELDAASAPGRTHGVGEKIVVCVACAAVAIITIAWIGSLFWLLGYLTGVW